MNKFNLKIGMKNESSFVVEEKHTAAAYGSGTLYVFSTPAMIGLIENSALNCVDSIIGEKYSTVGIHLDVKHIAATKMGQKVRAVSELIEIEGKKLLFKVEAFDEEKKIGEGYHSRYIIDFEKFMSQFN
ncbi:thioesterase family protein [Clostridiaceae bacterium HSG29]|nr:thioesterase family protein [Clostridiaceae bacterium HSG29]